MSNDPVLIAAFSARALAQSARRAGFAPYVVDCFGDLDTEESAAAWRCLPARVQTGFIYRPLLAALESLAAEAPKAPIGLVLGSGFECNPKLVAKLGERFRLLGNSADTIRDTKDPETFFGNLARLGIRHPETTITAPSETAGWLMKRRGGSGGLHIHRCPETPRPDPRRYFQREIKGEAISLFGIVSGKSSAFATSRQWGSPLPRRPYRYGGAAGSLMIDDDLEARLISTALEVTDALGLKGIVSFDFLVDDGDPSLIEVNPRPGATLDIFDDTSGTVFKAHMEACLDGDPARFLAEEWHPPIARAQAFLYADRGSLTIPTFDWPTWAADRPRPQTAISRGQPVATVITEGNDLASVEADCRSRLMLLEDRLFSH